MPSRPAGGVARASAVAASDWGRAEVEKAEVVDGAAVLTVPAAADKGFFILKSRGNAK